MYSTRISHSYIKKNSLQLYIVRGQNKNKHSTVPDAPIQRHTLNTYDVADSTLRLLSIQQQTHNFV